MLTEMRALTPVFSDVRVHSFIMSSDSEVFYAGIARLVVHVLTNLCFPCAAGLGRDKGTLYEGPRRACRFALVFASRFYAMCCHMTCGSPLRLISNHFDRDVRRDVEMGYDV